MYLKSYCLSTNTLLLSPLCDSFKIFCADLVMLKEQKNQISAKGAI
jgi:hypothetical protein